MHGLFAGTVSVSTTSASWPIPTSSRSPRTPARTRPSAGQRAAADLSGHRGGASWKIAEPHEEGPRLAGHGRRAARPAARRGARPRGPDGAGACPARDPPARRATRRSRRPGSGCAGRRPSSCRACSRSAGRPPARTRRRRASPARDGLLAAFDARLPFELTRGSAARSGRRSRPTSPRDHPMHRLLQGEVGSGKTLVALRAMLTVVDAGGQAALLAPTEVLATQHHRSIDRAARSARAGRAARRCRERHPCRPADRVVRRPPPGGQRCSTRRAGRPGSSSARTRCWRTRSTSSTSAWWSSTSSTGSASSNAMPCGPRATGRRTCWS